MRAGNTWRIGAYSVFMRTFHCDACDQLVFFENTSCVNSHRLLAYLPDLQRVGTLEPAEGGTWRRATREQDERRYRTCANYAQFKICNWAVPADDPNPFCQSCRLTTVIPDLEQSHNIRAWERLESAKRRLVYSLIDHRLPLRSRLDDPAHGLAFNFMGDTPGGPRVLTGHDEGVITRQHRRSRRCRARAPASLDARAVSHAARPFPARDRALLLGCIDQGSPRLMSIRRLFGDETADYDQALQAHYPKRSAARLAPAIHQRIRQRSPVGRLGRDLGALPAHDRHAGDGIGVRPVARAAAEQ